MTGWILGGWGYWYIRPVRIWEALLVKHDKEDAPTLTSLPPEQKKEKKNLNIHSRSIFPEKVIKNSHQIYQFSLILGITYSILLKKNFISSNFVFTLYCSTTSSTVLLLPLWCWIFCPLDVFCSWEDGNSIWYYITLKNPNMDDDDDFTFCQVWSHFLLYSLNTWLCNMYVCISHSKKMSKLHIYSGVNVILSLVLSILCWSSLNKYSTIYLVESCYFCYHWHVIALNLCGS